MRITGDFAIFLQVSTSWTPPFASIGTQSSKFTDGFDGWYFIGQATGESGSFFKAIATIGLGGLPHLFNQSFFSIGRCGDRRAANCRGDIAGNL